MFCRVFGTILASLSRGSWPWPWAYPRGQWLNACTRLVRIEANFLLCFSFSLRTLAQVTSGLPGSSISRSQSHSSKGRLQNAKQFLLAKIRWSYDSYQSLSPAVQHSSKNRFDIACDRGPPSTDHADQTLLPRPRDRAVSKISKIGNFANFRLCTVHFFDMF